MGTERFAFCRRPPRRVALTVESTLPDGATVLVDTKPIIYVLEGNALAKKFEPIFNEIDSGRLQAIVTPITLAEVMTGPLRTGNEALAERYRNVLTHAAGWTLREIDGEISVLAARLRVQHKLKLPDAFQLAVALHDNCHALVTHDRDFSKVASLLRVWLGD